MDFSNALRALKDGRKVARFGGKLAGGYIVLRAGYPQGVPVDEGTAATLRIPVGETREFAPYFLQCRPDGVLQPWAIDVTDILADDWMVLDY